MGLRDPWGAKLVPSTVTVYIILHIENIILHIENRNAQIPIKVNNKLTKRFSVKELVMQGSVWGSLKCSTTMDKLNKEMLKEDTLKYYYQKDKDIPIGVLGMVDDTIDISECGHQAVQKNAILNSFFRKSKIRII